MSNTIRYRKWSGSSGLTCAATAAFLLLGCEAKIFSDNVGVTGVSPQGGPGGAGGPGQTGSGISGSNGGLEASDRLATPVARLTNQEFINSAKALLRLPQDVQLPDDAEKRLAAEPMARGLTNDANNQQLTQVALAGYSTFADALTDKFLEGVKTNDDLAARLRCSELGASAGDLAACTRSFAKSLVPRAYRRDVSEQELSEVAGLIDRVDAIIVGLSKDSSALASHVLRIKTVVRQLLLSPHFLLLVERGVDDASGNQSAPKRLTSFELATRLAYFATASLPDDALLDAARQGKLADPQARLEQAQRLLNSETGRARFVSTLKDWLSISPEAASADDIRVLTDFLGKWFSEEKPFSDLYQGAVTVNHVDGTKSEQPFGVLGLRAFIMSHSSFPTPGFINRGVFVVESLLCGTLPGDVPAGAIDGAGGTEREVFDGHARQPCASCHRMFDNYGAAFQKFDTESGLYDPTDQKLGTGFQVYDLGGISGIANDVADLGRLFGTSARAPDCVAELWYRHALRRGFMGPEGDRATLDGLVGAWLATGNTSMKSLLSVIVTSDEFVTLVP